MANLWKLLKNRLLVPPDVKTSFKGRYVIVTGANTGLGFEAAMKICALGADLVILGVRDLDKGEAAKTAIQKRTGRKDCIEVWELDMLSYDSIKAFAVKAMGLDHLDVAILNAGVHMTKYEESEYDWEKDLQVNFLSTMLLGMLLIEKLEQSKNSGSNHPPTLEFVSSSLYKMVPHFIFLQPDVLQHVNAKQNFTPRSQYATSKSLLQCYAVALSSIYDRRTVKIMSVHPGICRTKLSRGYPCYVRKLGSIFMFLFFRTAEQGARNLVRAADQGTHGMIWKDDHNQHMNPIETESKLLQGIRQIPLRAALERDWPEAAHVMRNGAGWRKLDSYHPTPFLVLPPPPPPSSA